MHLFLARQMGRQRLAIRLLDKRLNGRGVGSALAFSSCSSSSSSSSCSISRAIFSEDWPNCIRFSLAMRASSCAIFRPCVFTAPSLPHQRLERFGIRRQIGKVDLHGRSVRAGPAIRACALCRELSHRRNHPASSGLCVRIGARQSMPSRRSPAAPP